MNKILIIDDDDQLRRSFEKVLTGEGYQVLTAASGEAGIQQVRLSKPDVVILDMRLPGINGLETYKAIAWVDNKIPVIIMTAFGTTETAIEATKMGAFDYVLKPFDIPDMLSIIKQALEACRFMHYPVRINADPDLFLQEGIIGRSVPMQEVYKSIGRVAATDATVLIRGESGTGKELAARAVYQHSRRAQQSFLVINCVAIPDALLESELFGYEKGAFTGANHRKIGKIEQACGGTVFLDEIGDMPANLQSKMLRLLQEKNIERLGGRETIPVDVRIIAATNRDLETAITENRFREDLYYRLKVVTVWLPPLRERRGDIPLLSEYFLSRFSAEAGIHNPGITENALDLLKGYHWPGNVRELSNIIRKSLIFNRGAPLNHADIKTTLMERNSTNSAGSDDSEKLLQEFIRKELNESSSNNLFDMLMDRYACLLISEALCLTAGNRSKAAKLLGLSRPTLHSKIEKFGIKMKTSVKNTDESL